MTGGGVAASARPVEAAPRPVEAAPRRSAPARVAIAGAALVVFAAFVSLGTWQLQRLRWKLDLIARVDARVHAAPAPAPGPEAWARLDAGDDAYRHVAVRGHYRAHEDAFVEAVTAFGGGFWVLTPFETDRGFTVLIDRGFVPPDRRAAASRDLDPREREVTGLLRLTEPGGGFLRANDPAADRWYSRDVAAIARARGLGGEGAAEVAPYFIDAAAAPSGVGSAPLGADAGPIAGLTVVDFPNNHLVYALTWYAMAASLAGAAVWVVRDERRRSAA